MTLVEIECDLGTTNLPENIRFVVFLCHKVFHRCLSKMYTHVSQEKKSLCSWERMTNLILSHLPLIYHERAVIYETKRVETIIFHYLYERRFSFLRKGKISVSTHNILKQSLRHFSDQSAFITFGRGGGWVERIWWDRGEERKGDQ